MLKYYVYISDTKVNMLYSQIPAKFLEKVQGDVRLNFGFLSGTLKKEKKSEENDVIKKLGSVNNYILQHESVGTVENPLNYISGRLRLKYGIVSEYASDIAFFGGEINGKLIGLIGATRSLLGEPKNSESNHAPYYYTLEFLNGLIKMNEKSGESPPFYNYDEAIKIAIETINDSPHSLEFLAKVLHHDENFVLATPIYVSISE
ncbi:SAVMC3_10250 family protein [Algoriphagus halophytocola]|uniref:DUF7019 family protein n=1 Tax=Algoriphagus halophytocola TaxID=2991499 RepID=UPI0022DE6DDD|nr:SAVMC3_10250 family protein [Algoriphagus sp. TR-M9]WBL42368.1 SAVMC3_10250 family protein [Algoriphagus sp. TR-M9]WBL43095.1 SAVMC3_10250 family protein [Algoriphagus sp. TR-M9]